MQATHGAVNTATEASTNLLQTLFKVPVVPGTHGGERLKKCLTYDCVPIFSPLNMRIDRGDHIVSFLFTQARRRDTNGQLLKAMAWLLK